MYTQLVIFELYFKSHLLDTIHIFGDVVKMASQMDGGLRMPCEKDYISRQTIFCHDTQEEPHTQVLVMTHKIQLHYPHDKARHYQDGQQ